MKTLFATDGHTITLEGDVEHPTATDMERVQAIRDELKARHDGGIIAHRSSKASGYKRLTIEWRSKPKLEE